MSDRNAAVAQKRNYKCFWLFVSLVLLSFFHPFSRIIDWIFPMFRNLAGTLLYTGVLLAGVYALSDTKRHVRIAVLLAVPALALNWMEGFVESESLRVARLSFTLIFVIFASVRLLNYVLKGKEVSVDKIFAALSVYLLFGHAWAFIFMILELVQPGSFSGLSQQGMGNGSGSELIYYSFVTITTLGYGEITPLSIAARNLAAMEAVTGVLYTATLVARLVGMYKGEQGGENL